MFKGTFADKHSGIPPYAVAIKQLKEQHTAADRLSLLREAAVMAQLSLHDNVCGLIGVVTAGDPVMLVVQYAEHGSLEDFLRTRSGIAELSVGGKLRIAEDVAKGLVYIHGEGFVHCDVAARNVLLDASFRCMVSDFGRTHSLGPGIC